MATATLNLQNIGDSVISICTLSSRSVIEQDPSAIDGIITRNRGGGRLVILLTPYKLCSDYASRLNYLTLLRQSLSNSSAQLTITPDHPNLPTVSFSNCLLLDIEEVRSFGNYIEFRLSFLTSAF